MPDLLRLQDAARRLGISYPTLKQWIYGRKIRSLKTPGGHHRIPSAEIERLTGRARATSKSRKGSVDLFAISGRNKLAGTVSEVRFEGLLAQVTIDIGGQSVTAIITRGACEELGLRKGRRAIALIKATEVMVISRG